MREQDTGQGKIQWESCSLIGRRSVTPHRPTTNERARYRARENSVGGVTDLRPMREQDTGQGKIQWEESHTYDQ